MSLVPKTFGLMSFSAKNFVCCKKHCFGFENIVFKKTETEIVHAQLTSNAVNND